MSGYFESLQRHFDFPLKALKRGYGKLLVAVLLTLATVIIEKQSLWLMLVGVISGFVWCLKKHALRKEFMRNRSSNDYTAWKDAKWWYRRKSIVLGWIIIAFHLVFWLTLHFFKAGS